MALAMSSPVVEQKILLSVDGSEQSEAAVKYYLERLHRPGNKLLFVHCIELPELNLNKARDLHMSPGVLADLWKEEEQKTKVLEERMKGLLREKGVAGVLKTTSGKPGEAICRMAEDENAAMIIVAMRGMGKVRRTILGSVSDYLIHHAHCPVVVCRHSSKSRHGSGSDSKARSRHASGPEVGRHSRHASGDVKSRHTSGDAHKKLRHVSGDSMSFRQRLASWGRSLSFHDERSHDGKEASDKENQEVVVPVEQVHEVAPASASAK